uniref:Acid phosphatase/vanadium-dependent haloperoxidase-related protein n=1 Tax=Chloropicon laureae TaxID=464258 RepID=A0A7S2Z161_9CHLO|mmetsp:Transcript_14255/g.36740  ORF Transcript_14255/g.36740 Transcript_14255/m.36740 type:complete len:148 (+) Transcript_14255:124-567(+)
MAIFTNAPLLAAILSFVFAQVAKVFTTWYLDRKWDLTRLVGSGGMPSSHSAFVTGLCTAVGFANGTSSVEFAVCFVFSAIVMYDASGVRQHAGKQANVLNQIISELPPEHPVSEVRPLKDALGHTPIQVFAGACTGIIVGSISMATY